MTQTLKIETDGSCLNCGSKNFYRMTALKFEQKTFYGENTFTAKESPKGIFCSECNQKVGVKESHDVLDAPKVFKRYKVLMFSTENFILIWIMIITLMMEIGGTKCLTLSTRKDTIECG